MAFTQPRQTKNDWSDEDEECDMELDLGSTAIKKTLDGGSLWSNVITEQILEEGTSATSLIGNKGFSREVESYSIPKNVKISDEEKKETLIFDKKKFCADLFSDFGVDNGVEEEFGVIGSGTKLQNIGSIKHNDKKKGYTKKPYAKNNQGTFKINPNNQKTERYADKTILYKLPESCDNDTFIKALAEGLSERCVELIERSVCVLGQERCREIFEMVRQTEINGGMKTLDERRRRSPGGIYIYHLKNHPDITKQEKKCIINPPKKN
ncbi:Phosphorylated adapter RNA export protein, RNA-binding domain-containing protein [Strongyloides ratti]|uniref:Phosphorylated adapter RNA export protein n=1 Tax=Strongyloides ratti TaxID=34506 RepID=A0A090L888_STRRB|nr:Phosphorylated adapter RNA export protein, RNA-binding domain-containing protein [Strongyloides ratti]CEF66011.1 Phosphorylated adapter RNA export protein, RNA-binding domain-containing protein [Strongyloides ratti]